MSANAFELGRPVEILLVEDSPTDAGLTSPRVRHEPSPESSARGRGW